MPHKGLNVVAAILDISATVPEATVRDFTRACGRYREALGNSQSVAIRRGTIALVKGLRARTVKAKRQAPLKDVTKYDGPGPHYITPKGKNQKAQHRWAIRRRGGQDVKFYTKPYKPKPDDDLITSKAAARDKWAQYTRWGLAKHSWGWFMKALFKRSEQTGGNPKTKIDPRMVEGYRRETVTGTNPRVEILIVNKLDYIRKALPEAALADAMAAATRYIDGQIDNGLAKARKELT